MSNLKINDLQIVDEVEELSEEKAEKVSGGFIRVLVRYVAEKALDALINAAITNPPDQFGVQSTGNPALDAVNGGNLGA